jgi:DUF4097 and DUF4098 domain-containing protein YvlB
MGRCAERATVLAVFISLAGLGFAADQLHQEFHFKVRRHPSVSILNEYGPISVKSAPGRLVIVNATLHSNKVSVDSNQRGSRIEIVSHLLPGATAETGKVEYEVQLPADAAVTLDSSTGSLSAEGLRGDIVLVGNTGTVEVRNLSAGHLHIKTLDGPVTLTNVSNGHVEITSVSGMVAMKSVSGPLVQVNSNKGNIAYDGDFGGGGQYLLMTNSGNIDATAPAYASIDVAAESVKGKVVNDFSLQPGRSSLVQRAGSAFAGTLGKAASSVKLLSFSGKIHLKKRE